jgi:hypothetical protein
LKVKTIALWCENISGLYTARPIVEKYSNKSVKVYIYTRKKNIKITSDYFGQLPHIDIVPIESIDSIFLRLLDYIFRNLLTNPNFTDMYCRKRRPLGLRLYDATLGQLFYLRNTSVNKLYKSFFSHFGSRLSSNLLISISRVRSTYLLCGRTIRHISIMESWDHPVKSPYWCEPNVLMTWNRDLREDYRKNQNFRTVNISYVTPIKFRYIADRSRKNIEELLGELSDRTYISDIEFIKRNDVVMYIPTTSSVSMSHHIGELVIIDDLCQALRELGKILYIKPKPNGPRGDYDRFEERYKHVRVGCYATNHSGIDMLSEEYHTFRFLLLHYSSLIVNFGTTFVLEAALMQKPIFQMTLSGERYGNFARFSLNAHIKKYLLGNFSHTVTGINDIVKILSTQAESFRKNSIHLGEWIVAR